MESCDMSYSNDMFEIFETEMMQLRIYISQKEYSSFCIKIESRNVVILSKLKVGYIT